MKIGILGAGAMGSLFGGLLAEGGNDVVLVDVWRAHVDAINRRGLLMTHRGAERRSAGRATADPTDAGVMDAVMVWCKAPDTEKALRDAQTMLGPDTIVCTLQNGLGNADTVERVVPAERVVYGVTEIGAVVQGPAHIELTDNAWNGNGSTLLAARTASGLDGAQRLAAVLTSSGIQAELREDIDTVIWGKVAMACPMAPIVALTRLQIRHVAATAEMRELLAGLCDEVIVVANASGVPLPPEATRAHCFEVWDAVGDHLSSMGQDALAKRQTEIEVLSGEVVRQGARVGVPTPLNDVLARLMRLLQANYANQLGVS
jgi:2-dehydropantoate 2-reductase